MLNLDYKDVAEKYGGNKQKIAEAAALGALGPEGPLLALAAGQYIDRMRAARMQEQVPQQTVAQQVFNPQPQMPLQGAPQGAPAMPPQGLGALAPQGEAPMPEAPMPQMPMEAPAEEAPMGMAMGGVAGLPVPDDMFDEPTNGGFDDGYAGGGLVAFAGGGSSRRMTDEEYLAYIMKKESGGRDYDKRGRPLTSPRGAKYAMQVLDATARSPGYGVKPAQADTPEEYNRVGREYALALRKLYGDEGGAAAYNMGPGAYEKYRAGKQGMPAETRKYIAGLGAGIGAGADTTRLPERDMDAPQGRFNSFMDQIGAANRVYGELPEDKGSKEAIAYYEKQRSPENLEKERKNDMWASLAQIGASLMGTDSPNFLQAVGQAIGAALPGAEASRKERKAMEREAVKALSELYGMERKEAKEKVALARDLYGIEMGAEKEQADRAFRAEQADKALAASRADATTAFERQVQLLGMKDKGFDALVTANYNKLKAEADAGVWKTPMGNKPSEAVIQYWAQQHAIEQWAKRSGGQAQTNLFDATGMDGTSAPAGNAVDFSQLK